MALAKPHPEVPDNLFNPLEYEAAYIVGKLAGGFDKILIVGCCWGRDYFYLKHWLNKTDITLVDIAPQQHLPQLHIADLTKGLPFADGSFNCVIACEVLEHLFEDVFALREIRRVLTPDGRLVASVPFYNDQPEYHARIHSRPTIERTLRYAGFRIEEYVERGGWISFIRTLFVLRGVAKRLGATDESFNLRIAEADYRRGLRGKSFRFSRYLGCYLRAVKGEGYDMSQVQVQSFANNISRVF